MIATYISTTTFTVTGDQTTIFVTNRRLKCNCGVDGYKYGTITSSSYSDPNTTVILTTASDDLTTNLTTVEWSVVLPTAIPVHDHSDENNGGSTFAGIVIADGGTIGQAAGPLLTFDDTDNYLEITGCSVGIGTSVPGAPISFGSNVNAQQLLIYENATYRYGFGI